MVLTFGCQPAPSTPPAETKVKEVDLTQDFSQWPMATEGSHWVTMEVVVFCELYDNVVEQKKKVYPKGLGPHCHSYASDRDYLYRSYLPK